jgi:hypothetical protein
VAVLLVALAACAVLVTCVGTEPFAAMDPASPTVAVTVTDRSPTDRRGTTVEPTARPAAEVPAQDERVRTIHRAVCRAGGCLLVPVGSPLLSPMGR